MSARPIYFDYAATTPVDPRVAVRIAECLSGGAHGAAAFGNPSSSAHVYGRGARRLVEQARASVTACPGTGSP